jgi:hypothetical protein
MAMSVIQVGLVDTTGNMDPELVEAAAAAVNIQVTRDLPQFWPIQATVRYLPSASRIPSGVWPVQLVSHLPPGEGGFHLSKHNQPYAKVIATPGSDDWTVDVSHETIEMLVDPSGNRLQTSQAIEIDGDGVKDTTGEFGYLVEACDPCEADQYAYMIQGVAVSDFITPHFYDPVETPGTRYSFTGAIKAPRQLLPGGYISFIDEEDGHMKQILWVDPNSPPQLKDLGPANAKSLREWVDNGVEGPRVKHRKPNHALMELCKAQRSHRVKISEVRAKLYRPK